MKYNPISNCRISGSTNLKTILNLGHMSLSGVFPPSINTPVTSGPMTLVVCPDSGLVQLGQNYNLDEMYGMNYGYRSGLNQSMVKHLTDKVAYLQTIKSIGPESTVIDIGGNDGTLLKAYDIDGLTRVCFDPTASKWSKYYEGTDITVHSGFFDGNSNYSADIITSISMFYDLPNPNQFVQDVKASLAPAGIWHSEQSYLPSMIKARSFDTICQEHLEYYTLTVVNNLLEANGMRIIDVQFNDINGGSFAFTAGHAEYLHEINVAEIDKVLKAEAIADWSNPASYKEFIADISEARTNLIQLINKLNSSGKKVAALGASTKGNVLLQWCGLTKNDISFISDVNPLKWGCYTPGSGIPIISEKAAAAERPDYMLVLPWHFKKSITEREQTFLSQGGKLIFPLPYLDIVG
tara:strand:- start:265 stop:1488 length:1224 start_codon:yes stop_codon:yes gene_type:complete